jgi:hypothetical protein
MVHVGCELGNRCQQSMYSICKTYLHGERSPWGLSEPVSEGGVQGTREPTGAVHGLWVGPQASVKCM